MSSLFIVYQFQFGMCKKINLENGINIISPSCVLDVSPVTLSIIPIHIGFLNGDILEEETKLNNNDIVSMDNFHLIIRAREIVTIDLTEDEEMESPWATPNIRQLNSTPSPNPYFNYYTQGYSSPNWSPTSPSYTPKSPSC